ncbi:amino acid permease [Candidatus Poribacteria bacterium]|nr:amino acid permease [Candidatus Poribacteria bacterium]
MQLKKALNLLDIFCIATGAMISSGLFILPGIAHSQAGPAIILSYLIAGTLSLAGMLSIAEMTTAMPKAGGDCFTIIRSLGPAIGTVAGLLSWFSLSMKSAFALVGMSIFTAPLINIDIHIIAVFFCIIFLVINLIGIKEAGITQMILVFGLLALMFIYIVRGLPAIKIEYLVPFAPKGVGAVFSTAGFVFVSYGGLLKIASVAEEIKNPSRDIPLGMIISLIVVSVFYTLMIFVTSGVLEVNTLHNSLTPISDGASVFLGPWGRIALSIAAILAFLSTANAGIMTAARSLVPLSRDKLFPEVFSKINSRFQTPHYSLILTGSFIIVSLFLELKILAEAASIVLILTNILSCLSVIILRESRLLNYQPTFRVPLYPWSQIVGIVGFIFLIFEIGKEAWIISLMLMSAGFLTYWFYGRIRAVREYAMLHIIERITAKELTSNYLEAELKEIIKERDNIIEDRFDKMVENAIIMDIDRSMGLEDFFQLVDNAMYQRIKVQPSTLANLLMKRERESTTVLNEYLAIPHIIIEGEKSFDICIVRCREGIIFSEGKPNVHTVFVLVGTRDERNFHLNALAAIAQIVQNPNFEKKWMEAKDKEALRDIILLGKRKRMQ